MANYVYYKLKNDELYTCQLMDILNFLINNFSESTPRFYINKINFKPPFDFSIEFCFKHHEPDGFNELFNDFCEKKDLYLHGTYFSEFKSDYDEPIKFGKKP